MPKSTLALLVLLVLALVPGATLAEAGPASSDAVRVETAFGPVLVTPQIPADHYGERYADGAYWLPGVRDASTLVHKVIKAARARRDTGTRVWVRTYLEGTERVFVTETRPFAGVYSLPAAGGHAWIAGVERPDADERQALEAVAAEETAAAEAGAPASNAEAAEPAERGTAPDVASNSD